MLTRDGATGLIRSVVWKGGKKRKEEIKGEKKEVRTGTGKRSGISHVSHDFLYHSELKKNDGLSGAEAAVVMHSLSVCVCVHKLYHIVSPLRDGFRLR